MVDGIVHVPASFASKQKKSGTANNLEKLPQFRVRKKGGGGGEGIEGLNVLFFVLLCFVLFSYSRKKMKKKKKIGFERRNQRNTRIDEI